MIMDMDMAGMGLLARPNMSLTSVGQLAPRIVRSLVGNSPLSLFHRPPFESEGV